MQAVSERSRAGPARACARPPRPAIGRTLGQLSAALVLATGLFACGDDSQRTTSPGSGSDSVSTPSPSNPSPSNPNPSNAGPSTSTPPAASPSGSDRVDPSLDRVVQRARADLAGRLGVAESSIEVVSAQIVTWPDAGLGCRAPGRVYAQVVSDGSRTVLAHAGRQFDYHTGGRTTDPFLCEHPG